MARKGRHIVNRTIYNGPFVLHDQANSCIIQSNCQLTQKTGFSPSLKQSNKFQKRDYFSVINSQSLHETTFPVIQVQAVKQTGMSDFHRLHFLSPKRENCDTSCHPVYNFSFLEESSEEQRATKDWYCQNSKVKQSPLKDAAALISPDVNNSAKISVLHDSDMAYIAHGSVHKPVQLHSGLPSPNVYDLGVKSSKYCSSKNEFLKEGNVLEEIPKPVSMCWRKAAHGYVCEYLQDPKSHLSSRDAPGGAKFLRTSPSFKPAANICQLRNISTSSVSFIQANADSLQSKNSLTKPQFNLKSSKSVRRMGDCLGQRKRRFNQHVRGKQGAPRLKQFRGYEVGRVSSRRDPFDFHNLCPPPPYYFDPYEDPMRFFPPPPLPYDHWLPPRLDPFLDPMYDPMLFPRTSWGTESPSLLPLEDWEFWNRHHSGRLRDDEDFTADLDLNPLKNAKKNGYLVHGRGQVRCQTSSTAKNQLGHSYPHSGIGQTGDGHYPNGRDVFSRGERGLWGNDGHIRGNWRSQRKGGQPHNTRPNATAQTSCKADVANMSPVGKLQRFIAKLKAFPDKENAIQTIENCITASHIPIKTNFTVEDLTSSTCKKPIFSGVLLLDNICISQSTSTSKKLLKHTVYENALNLLRTKSVEDLLAQQTGHLESQDLPEQACSQPANQYELADFRSKLIQLQDKIRAFKHSDQQPVMMFDGAVTESKCGLTANYSAESIKTERGVPMYTKISVSLEGKVLASAVALSKKESKSRACQKVIDLFIKCDVDTIIKECFDAKEKEESIPPAIQELIKKHRESLQDPRPLSLVAQQDIAPLLDKMIADLNAPLKAGVNTVMTIDKNCVQFRIKLLAVYKIAHSQEEKHIITCDLYIVDRFIAQGKGSMRKLAQSDAYSKGGELLKRSKSSDILTSFPKFNEVELKEANVMDVVYKGYSKVCESNLCRLNRLKQLPEERRTISELVIIEHKDWMEDRKKHAHCILNQSATQCGCLLEWTTEPENGCFRCIMKLQGQEISRVLAKQRKAAVGLASAIALFNLYETQAVVQGFHADYPKVWIPRNELVEMSQNLGEENGVKASTTEATPEVDEKFAVAVAQKLDHFFSQPTLEEFVTAPDWRPEEKRHLRNLAMSKGLRVVTGTYCENQLLVMSKKYNLLEMVNILEEQPDKSQGRYRLLPPEAKPSYNDIAGEVAANESFLKSLGAVTGQQNNRDRAGNDACALEAMDNDINDDDDDDDDDNDDDDDDDLNYLLDSDAGDVFVTANNTFVQDTTDSDNGIKVSPPIQLSEIPLPKSTSTPSRPMPVKTDSVSQTSKSQISKATSSRWDQTLDASESLVVQTATSTPPSQSLSVHIPPPPPPPPASSGTKLVRNPLEPRTASLFDKSWTEMNLSHSEGIGQHQQAAQFLNWRQPHPSQEATLKYNRSFDVEAGRGACWVGTEHYFTKWNQYSDVHHWQHPHDQTLQQNPSCPGELWSTAMPGCYPTTYNTYSET